MKVFNVETTYRGHPATIVPFRKEYEGNLYVLVVWESPGDPEFSFAVELEVDQDSGLIDVVDYHGSSRCPWLVVPSYDLTVPAVGEIDGEILLQGIKDVGKLHLQVLLKKQEKQERSKRFREAIRAEP